MPWFEFNQNNSGGSLKEDADLGIGPLVWIEAADADDANKKAQHIGIYFNGVSEEIDCACCGDRWHPAWGEGQLLPSKPEDWYFDYRGTIFLHTFAGRILSITKATVSNFHWETEGD
jgi:hypothetical protein